MIARYCLLFSLLAVVAQNAAAEAVFGRLYTTPKQREQLDDARRRQPTENIIVTVTEQQLPENKSAPQQTGTVPAISLDGIVYRSDGKNTAWINRNSTNAGNLENQYTRVGERDVESNRARITLPDNQTRIELKVGQQYDVNSKQITDMASDPVDQNPSATTEGRRP